MRDLIPVQLAGPQGSLDAYLATIGQLNRDQVAHLVTFSLVNRILALSS